MSKNHVAKVRGNYSILYFFYKTLSNIYYHRTQNRGGNQSDSAILKMARSLSNFAISLFTQTFSSEEEKEKRKIEKQERKIEKQERKIEEFMAELKVYYDAVNNPLVQRNAVKSFDFWLKNGKYYTLLEPKTTIQKSSSDNSDQLSKVKPDFSYVDDFDRREEERKIRKKLRNKLQEQIEWAERAQYLDEQRCRSERKESYYRQLEQQAEQRVLLWNLEAERKYQKRRIEYENMCAAAAALPLTSKKSSKNQSRHQFDVITQPASSQSVLAPTTASIAESTSVSTTVSTTVSISVSTTVSTTPDSVLPLTASTKQDINVPKIQFQDIIVPQTSVKEQSFDTMKILKSYYEKLGYTSNDKSRKSCSEKINYDNFKKPPSDPDHVLASMCSIKRLKDESDTPIDYYVTKMLQISNYHPTNSGNYFPSLIRN